jgi:hypothetical protein
MRKGIADPEDLVAASLGRGGHGDRRGAAVLRQPHSHWAATRCAADERWPWAPRGSQGQVSPVTRRIFPRLPRALMIAHQSATIPARPYVVTTIINNHIATPHLGGRQPQQGGCNV